VTPRQYIDDLKKQFNSKPEFDKKKLSKHVTSESAKAFVNKIGGIDNFDFGEYLLHKLRPRLSKDIIELIDLEIISIGEIVNPTPYIYVKKIEDEGYAIIIHSGLKNFIYKVARVIATRSITHEEQNSDDLRNLLEHKEFTRLIAEIFWWYQESGNTFGPSNYPISENQKSYAGKLTSEAELFFVAHEIGHIIQDLAKVKDYNDIPGSSDAHSEEHMSDFIGFNIVMNFDNERDSLFEYQMSYAGIEFVFHIYRALELVGLEFSTSHPKFEFRIKFLRERLKTLLSSEDYEIISMLSIGLESMFDEVIKILRNPEKHEQYYHTESEKLVNKFENLLAEFSKSVPLEYLEFNKKAFALLGKGYPTDILLKMIDIKNETFRKMKELKDEDENLPHGTLITLNKYKLLIGLIQDMNEPAKSIYLKEM